MLKKIYKKIYMLYMMRTSRYLSENHYLKKYDIGEFTKGYLEVLDWGDHTELSIGKFCSIAKDVKIMLGGEHRYDWFSTYAFPAYYEELNHIADHQISKGGVKIGNDVWIGYGATILSGVTIGNGAIIGARAVVAKNIPDYSIAVGNPARVIRQRFDEETVAQLNQVAWWNWSLEKIKQNADIIMSNNLNELVKRNNQ